MDIITLSVIILIAYIIAVWLCFKYIKRLNQNFSEKRVKINKNNNLFLIKYQPENEGRTDILRRMYLLMFSLNEDGRSTNNCIVFDYSMSYPRVFNTSAPMLAKLVDALTQFMLINIKNSTIVVKFLLINYQHKQIKFNISVWSEKNFLKRNNGIESIRSSINQKSKIYLNIAENIAHENGSYIRFETENGLKISTDVGLEIADTKNRAVEQLQVKHLNEFKILIADPNKYAFETLKNTLLHLGFDVKPTNDWHSAKRHIQDMMFVPNVVFISDTLLNDIDFGEVEEQLLHKSISIVIIHQGNICKNNDSRIYIQYMSQPFLHESLISILNNCHQYRQNLGGGTAHARIKNGKFRQF